MAGVKVELTCLQCGFQDVKIEPIRTSNGVLQIQTTCRGCNNKAFLGQNLKNDEWVMPFGKYKGYTINEIVHEDINYAEWAASNMENENIRARFEAELG